MVKSPQTSEWGLLFIQPFRDTSEPAINGEKKKRDINIFKQANKRRPLYDTMFAIVRTTARTLTSVGKWDIQFCSDIKAILHLSYFVFWVLSKDLKQPLSP